MDRVRIYRTTSGVVNVEMDGNNHFITGDNAVRLLFSLLEAATLDENDKKKIQSMIEQPFLKVEIEKLIDQKISEGLSEYTQILFNVDVLKDIQLSNAIKAKLKRRL